MYTFKMNSRQLWFGMGTSWLVTSLWLSVILKYSLSSACLMSSCFSHFFPLCSNVHWYQHDQDPASVTAEEDWGLLCHMGVKLRAYTSAVNRLKKASSNIWVPSIALLFGILQGWRKKKESHEVSILFSAEHWERAKLRPHLSWFLWSS